MTESIRRHPLVTLFIVSPDVASTGDLALPLLAAVAKWVLVLVVVLVADPRLVRGPRPEALPRTSVEAAPTVGVAHKAVRPYGDGCGK
jgi:hypothetical protein